MNHKELWKQHLTFMSSAQFAIMRQKTLVVTGIYQLHPQSLVIKPKRTWEVSDLAYCHAFVANEDKLQMRLKGMSISRIWA